MMDTDDETNVVDSTLCNTTDAEEEVMTSTQQQQLLLQLQQYEAESAHHHHDGDGLGDDNTHDVEAPAPVAPVFDADPDQLVYGFLCEDLEDQSSVFEGYSTQEEGNNEEEEESGEQDENTRREEDAADEDNNDGEDGDGQGISTSSSSSSSGGGGSSSNNNNGGGNYNNVDVELGIGMPLHDLDSIDDHDDDDDHSDEEEENSITNNDIIDDGNATNNNNEAAAAGTIMTCRLRTWQWMRCFLHVVLFPLLVITSVAIPMVIVMFCFALMFVAMVVLLCVYYCCSPRRGDQAAVPFHVLIRQILEAVEDETSGLGGGGPGNANNNNEPKYSRPEIQNALVRRKLIHFELTDQEGNVMLDEETPKDEATREERMHQDMFPVILPDPPADGSSDDDDLEAQNPACETTTTDDDGNVDENDHANKPTGFRGIRKRFKTSRRKRKKSKKSKEEEEELTDHNNTYELRLAQRKITFKTDPSANHSKLFLWKRAYVFSAPLRPEKIINRSNSNDDAAADELLVDNSHHNFGGIDLAEVVDEETRNYNLAVAALEEDVSSSSTSGYFPELNSSSSSSSSSGSNSLAGGEVVSVQSSDVSYLIYDREHISAVLDEMVAVFQGRNNNNNNTMEGSNNNSSSSFNSVHHQEHHDTDDANDAYAYNDSFVSNDDDTDNWGPNNVPPSEILEQAGGEESTSRELDNDEMIIETDDLNADMDAAAAVVDIETGLVAEHTPPSNNDDDLFVVKAPETGQMTTAAVCQSMGDAGAAANPSDGELEPVENDFVAADVNDNNDDDKAEKNENTRINNKVGGETSSGTSSPNSLTKGNMLQATDDMSDVSVEDVSCNGSLAMEQERRECEIPVGCGDDVACVPDAPGASVEDSPAAVPLVEETTTSEVSLLLASSATTEEVNQVPTQPGEGEAIFHDETVRAPMTPMESSEAAAAKAMNSNATASAEELVSSSPPSLPQSEHRGISSYCNICLLEYEIGDIVVWSRRPNGCHHAWHEDCLLDWLQRKPTCPNCRQEYFAIEDSPVQHEGSSSEEEGANTTIP